jgi:hypothetical protein
MRQVPSSSSVQRIEADIERTKGLTRRGQERSIEVYVYTQGIHATASTTLSGHTLTVKMQSKGEEEYADLPTRKSLREEGGEYRWPLNWRRWRKKEAERHWAGKDLRNKIRRAHVFT